MEENTKEKRFNILKFLIFPNGLIASFVSVPAVYLALSPIEPISNEWKLNISIMIFLGLIILNLYFNFWYQKPQDDKCNIYIMLCTPEDIKLNRFIEDIGRDLSEANEYNVRFCIPTYLQRETFYKMQKWNGNKKNFWETKFFKYFAWRTNATVVLSGCITKRKNVTNKYIITFSPIYRYAQLSDGLKSFIEKNANRVYTPKLQVEQEKEVSGFNGVCRYIEEAMSFIVGLSEFSCGHLENAFKIHYNLCKESKSSLFSKKANFREVLGQEFELLYLICVYNEQFVRAGYFIQQYKSLGFESILYVETQFLMLKASTQDEMLCNARECASLLREPSNNPTHQSNQAYIYLILRRYKKSTKLYKDFFTNKKGNYNFDYTVQSLKRYCEFAKGKPFERVYAVFLLGQISLFYDEDYQKALEYFEETKALLSAEDKFMEQVECLLGKCNQKQLSSANSSHVA